MTFDPTIPYDDLATLPPPADVESKAVLKQCLASTRALAELKGIGGLIPDQAILINAIPLQEARLSSEIENIVTTQDDLFLAAMDESKVTDPATKEVLRYRTALKRGSDLLAQAPLSLGTILDVCRVLRELPGLEFRCAEEPVRLGNPDTVSTPWFVWPSPTISLRPSTHLPMATGAPAVSSIFCTSSRLDCSIFQSCI